MATVAAKCGYSVMTVSLILNGKGDLFKPETVKRVTETALELDYRPNSLARSVRSGRMNAVTLLAVDDSAQHPWFAGSLLVGAMRVLYEKDIQLNVSHIPVEKVRSGKPVPKLFREWCADGLLVNYVSHLPEEMMDYVRKTRMPMICLNDVQEGLDCIYPDDEGNSYRSVKRLIDLGHRDIAIVCFQKHGHYSFAARLDGYRKAMKEAGLEPLELITSFVDPEKRMAKGVEFLKAKRRPTAMVTILGEHDALPMHLAACSLGLSVPEDLSIITISDGWATPFAAYTYMQLPFEKVGAEAASRLLEKIEDPSLSIGHVAIQGTLCNDGLSVAPPPSSKKAFRRA